MRLLSHNLKMAHQLVTSAVDVSLKDHGLPVSAPQAYLLVALLDMDVSPSQKLLAEHASIDKMTTHEMIKRLEARGYLTRGKARKIPNSFGRETPIELTMIGTTAAKTAQKALAHVDALVRVMLGCFAAGFEDGLGELVDIGRKRTQVE